MLPTFPPPDTPVGPSVASQPPVSGSVARSFGWLVGEMGVKTLGSAAIGIVLARHFGPSDFGRLAVAMSLASVGKDFVSLGLNRIVQRELSSQPSRAGMIVCTHLVLGLLAASFIIAATSLFAFQIEDPVTRRLTLIFAWLSLPSAFGAADIWFLSRGDLRAVTLVKNGVWAFFLLLRFGLIFADASLTAFAIVALIDWTMSFAVAWLLFARRTAIVGQMRFSGLLTRIWARYGWPSAVLMIVAVTTDRFQQYLVQDLAGTEAAGHFAAGFRLAEIWWTIAPLAAAAILPRLAKQHSHPVAGYLRELRLYFDLSSAVTIVVAIVVTFAAPVVMPWVFGDRYAAASPIVTLLFWTAPPLFSAFARTQHLTVKKTLLVELPNSLTTAVLSIGLSLILTPRYGGVGAAAAITASWWIGVFVTPWMVPAARDLARLQLWSLTSLFRIHHLSQDVSPLIRQLMRKPAGGSD